ncbi:MAG TPA: hypothetical protein VKV03_06095 [Candidatus Binataceae bacterium]|nr:hypothetical protein [Candidatus Binataceae bacterium]
MTEYALLLAGIAVAAVAGYNSLGTSSNGAVNSASALLASGNSSAPVSGGGAGAGSGGSDPGNGSSGGSGDGHHDHHDGDGH